MFFKVVYRVNDADKKVLTIATRFPRDARQRFRYEGYPRRVSGRRADESQTPD